jgi:hypothetical protein
MVRKGEIPPEMQNVSYPDETLTKLEFWPNKFDVVLTVHRR